MPIIQFTGLLQYLFVNIKKNIRSNIHNIFDFKQIIVNKFQHNRFFFPGLISICFVSNRCSSSTLKSSFKYSHMLCSQTIPSHIYFEGITHTYTHKLYNEITLRLQLMKHKYNTDITQNSSITKSLGCFPFELHIRLRLAAEIQSRMHPNHIFT